MKRICKSLIYLFAAVLCAWLLCGCADLQLDSQSGQQEQTDVSASESDSSLPVVKDLSTDGRVPIAEWVESGAELQNGSKLIGDTLYYMDAKWNQETGNYPDASIYRKERETEAEEIISFQGAALVHYVVDAEENLYSLYAVTSEEITEYFLRKTDQEGNTFYDVPVQCGEDGKEQEIFERIGTAGTGEADSEGRICLMNPYGDLYFFDDSGSLYCMTGNEALNSSGGRYGLINAGDAGIWVYLAESKNMILHPVEMENGKLGEALELPLDVQDDLLIEVFSGYDKGILITDGDTLWKYKVAENEIIKMLDWGDSGVSLGDFQIDAIGNMPGDGVYVMVHQVYDDVSFVQIEYKDPDKIREKRVVTIGVMERYDIAVEILEAMISAFNRSNTDYLVEMMLYEEKDAFEELLDLHTDLIQGKGPDLFILGRYGLEVSSLLDKGVLENLAPYFAASDVVKEEDLLPMIRNAGTIDGEFVCLFTEYWVNGLLVEAGTTDNGGWTVDDYFALYDKYPGSMLMYYQPQYYKGEVLREIMRADLSSFLNWQDKECYFNTERFISLVERVKNLEISNPDIWNFETGYEDDAIMQRMYEREQLTNSFAASSLTVLEYWMDTLREGDYFLEMAGYPNQEGIPCFELSGEVPLGMNSASEVKDGAWAFMEFLASKEYQDGKEGLPIRQDSFEEYIVSDTAWGFMEVNLTDEERAYLRYMVENAYWLERDQANDIYVMISEETDGVWTGDKTAAEAAEIVQSRVSLYMNE